MQQKTNRLSNIKPKKMMVIGGFLITTLGIASLAPASPAYGEYAVSKPADRVESKVLDTENNMSVPDSILATEKGSITVISVKPEVVAPPPPPPIGEQALNVAMQYEGTPYVAYGNTPRGFDCSGLVMFSFAQVGVALPWSADEIGSRGTVISESEARYGDLVWWPGQHIGFWVSPGRIYDAAVPGTTVGNHQAWGNYLIVRL